MKPGKDAAKKPHLGKGQSWETFDRQMGPWLSTNGGAGVGMAWRGDEAFGALPERLPVAEDGENLVLELAGRADWIAQVPRFTATTQADRVTANMLKVWAELCEDNQAERKDWKKQDAQRKKDEYAALNGMDERGTHHPPLRVLNQLVKTPKYARNFTRSIVEKLVS